MFHRDLEVEELTERAAFASLKEPWQELEQCQAKRGAPTGPFLSASWFAIFAAHWNRRAAKLRLLVAHRRGRVVGILPLCEERRLLMGAPARVLRSLADEHTPRFDLLAADDQVASGLFHYLADRPGWDVLELREVPALHRSDFRHVGTEPLVREARRRGFLSGEWRSSQSPYLPLDAAHWEQGQTAKFRANLRRRSKKLAAEVGALELESITERAELALALEEGYALEASAWKGENGTAIAGDPVLRARYDALAHTFFSQGKLALFFLRAGGRRVAFHFGLTDGGVYYLLKPGYDATLSRYGLGHLLVDLVADHLRRKSIRELDFLGDNTPWKQSWTSRLRGHVWHYVVRPSLYGRALHRWKFACIPFLRRCLRKGG